MAQKERLRLNRYGTVINATSTKQELQLGDALYEATERLIEKFGLKLQHDKTVMLKDIVAALKTSFPSVSFSDPLQTSYMSPDGGILSILSEDGTRSFGQDVQQEIAALKSEAARRNPGLDMAVGGILAVDVRQAREQGVRSSRQRTRWRRR